jgi:3-methyl-2-oxobutanoate hydroxymethyltransferase
MQKNKIKSVIKKKGVKPIICLTAYSRTTAEILDKYCDIILVGDSVSMTLYGMKTTRDISIQTMINHGRTVKKFAKRSLVVFDMPYNSYKNKNAAYKNAKKVLKLTKCDAIKLEGGTKIVNTIKHLVKKGIPVMGHIGLLPQHSRGFKLRGKNLLQKKEIMDDAIALSKSGVFAIVIECVVESLAKEITAKIKVPSIGIGASKHCDGQILVIDDIIGLSNFYPKFVKRYFNVKLNIERAVKKYSEDVRKGIFPSSKHVYKI